MDAIKAPPLGTQRVNAHELRINAHETGVYALKV
jgi:hypothetical protein